MAIEHGLDPHFAEPSGIRIGAGIEASPIVDSTESSLYDPERSFMEQVMEIVGGPLVSSRAAAIAEREISAHEAEELRH